MRFASAAAIRAGLPLLLALTAADVVRAQSAPPVVRTPMGETPLKGTILPLPVTSSAGVASPPMYPGVRTSMRVTVRRARRGSTVTLRLAPPVTAGCSFHSDTPTSTVTAVVTSADSTVLLVPGMFADLQNPVPTTCRFQAQVTATREDGTESTITASASPTPAQLQTYVVTNTVDWLPRLAFTNVAASGECSGMSNGPGGIFRVGLLTSEGAQTLTDVTFKIRSGPFGTNCRWVSQPLLLPEGVRLTAVEVIPTESSRCSTTVPAAIVNAVGFASTGNPVRTPQGTVVGANPLGAGYPVGGLAPMTLMLSCSRTLANDHFATLVLASLTFVGPPNLTGFP
jgi:hypothetical protein